MRSGSVPGRFGLLWAGLGRSGPVRAVWTGSGPVGATLAVWTDLDRGWSGPVWTGTGLGPIWTGLAGVGLGGLTWSGWSGPVRAGSGRSGAVRGESGGPGRSG